MIVTIYHPDGRKTRKPVGYGGGLCNVATAPYEKRDVPGTVTKVRTPEADEEPVATAAVQEQLKAAN